MSSFPTIQQIILSENGNQDFTPRDTITIMVDPQEVGLLNGKDTYLRFNVKLGKDGTVAGTADGQFKATLDRGGGGGHSIISTVSIWNGNGSTLIEQLNDVPVWMGAKNYYDNTEGLENQRNLLEGLQSDGKVLQSQYFKNSALGVLDYTSVECCLPIYQSGILYGDSACPVAALGGLMIKIQLAEAQRAITALDCDGYLIDRFGAGAEMGPNGGSVENMPFTKAHLPPVGPAGELYPTASQDLPQCYQLRGAIVAGAQTQITVTAAAANLTPTGAPLVALDLRDNVNAPQVPADFPWLIGQTCGYLGDAGTLVNCGQITNITFLANVYTVTTTGYTALTATAANNCPCFAQLSNANQSATYTVSDVELVTSVVQPDPRYYQAMMSAMKSSGGYSWDIRSFNLYRNNLMKNIAQSQELIPTTEFRARGILMAQVNPTLAWNTSWATPVQDMMRNYQYVLGNVNTPLLPVMVDKEWDVGSNTWNATADEERLKALEASKIDIRQELHPSGCFLTGREVAKRGYSSNLNSVEVRYNQAWGVRDDVAAAQRTVMPQMNKLLNTYIHHFRKITCKPDACIVEF